MNKWVEAARTVRRVMDAAGAMLTDQQALTVARLYPLWQESVEYAMGDRVRHGGKLYKVRQAHTAQCSWLPGNTGSESLYERIDETHAGTAEDPIPYEGNMALESGRYYSEDGVLYLCNRDTGNAVHQPLGELVGLYVEVAQA